MLINFVLSRLITYFDIGAEPKTYCLFLQFVPLFLCMLCHKPNLKLLSSKTQTPRKWFLFRQVLLCVSPTFEYFRPPRTANKRKRWASVTLGWPTVHISRITSDQQRSCNPSWHPFEIFASVHHSRPQSWRPWHYTAPLANEWTL